MHGVTIWEDGDAGSASFLTDNLGYTIRDEAEHRVRLESGSDGLGTVVELRRAPGFWRGTDGTGTVHHVAFRAPDDQTVDEFHRAAVEAGYRDNGTPGERRVYHPGYDSAYVLDPDGNNVELVSHNR